MRCLYINCPMSGHASCPASGVCREFRRSFNIRINSENLELSPSEAIELFDKLDKALYAANIKYFDSPPEYWPSDKDKS